MEKIKFLLCSFLVMSFLSACSSDEIIDEAATIPEISTNDLMNLGEGKFYYYPGFSSQTTVFLKKGKKGWEETKVDAPKSDIKYTEEQLKDGILDSNFSRDYSILFPYGRMMHPNYFWFEDWKVYSDYSVITTDYPDWEYGDFRYSEIVPFLDYISTKTEKSSDIFKSEYWFSMLNIIEISDGNVLHMSFSEHPLRLKRGADYNYVLEEADGTKLVVRLEFKETKFGCDGVRLIYKAISQRPKYYQNFDSKEEAKEYIDSILATLTDE